jgi:hypothetical protein
MYAYSKQIPLNTLLFVLQDLVMNDKWCPTLHQRHVKFAQLDEICSGDFMNDNEKYLIDLLTGMFSAHP